MERAIPYVRERFFKGGRFRDLEDCRQQAERWCRDVAGLRVHGTTRRLPREVFEAEERDALQPFDGVLYDVPEWKAVTVHPDHHISFGQALYSAPTTSCPPGTKLEVRGDRALVRLYKHGTLVKVHSRVPRGQRMTDPSEYPPEKTSYALRSTDSVAGQLQMLFLDPLRDALSRSSSCTLPGAATVPGRGPGRDNCDSCRTTSSPGGSPSGFSPLALANRRYLSTVLRATPLAFAMLLALSPACQRRMTSTISIASTSRNATPVLLRSA